MKGKAFTTSSRLLAKTRARHLRIKLTIEVFYGKLTNSWFATCPKLDIAAEGKTKASVLRNLASQIK